MNAATVSSTPTEQFQEALGFVEKFSSCKPEEQRVIVRALLREMLGPNPQGEECLWNEDDTSFLYLISPPRRVELTVTPQRIAQWRAELASGKRIPHSDVLDWLREQNERESH